MNDIIKIQGEVLPTHSENIRLMAGRRLNSDVRELYETIKRKTSHIILNLSKTYKYTVCIALETPSMRPDLDNYIKVWIDGCSKGLKLKDSRVGKIVAIKQKTNRFFISVYIIIDGDIQKEKEFLETSQIKSVSKTICL